jgi:hypothetical protein
MKPATLLVLFAATLSAAISRSPSAATSALARTPSPEGARVYIVSPRDGDEVRNPVRVAFGLSGMGVAPAGVTVAGTGHHHLIVDAPLPAFDAPIGKDDQHLHFGAGQTETELTLPAGEHSLQLLLGDALHVPHDPPVYSAVVKITVVE